MPDSRSQNLASPILKIEAPPVKKSIWIADPPPLVASKVN
jgi:hypothetical protein